MKNKTWLITGASLGLGKSLAEKLAEKGFNVVVTARNVEKLADFQKENLDNVLVIRLDVTDLGSIQTAVSQAVKKFGGIDVLVNNAGYGYYELFESLCIADIQKQFDTNFYGVIRTMQEVLPQMRAQKSGWIVNISSIAGSVGMAGRSAYNASKFAVNGLSEGLAHEVKHLGIKVTVIEPGAFRTAFFDSGKPNFTAKYNDYQELADELNAQVVKMNDNQKGDPEKFAEVLIHLSEAENPPLRISVGEDASMILQKRIQLLQEENATWHELATSTSFESGESVAMYLKN
jgi:NAD(P)-dependent dehydrogenase (short-subunit alcohol dehydrogenase family)